MENGRGGEERGETNAVIIRGRRKYLTKFQGAFVAVKPLNRAVRYSRYSKETITDEIRID